MFIVGIDVAKRSHEVCMITSDGQTVQRPFSIRNNCTGYNLMLEKIRKHTNIKSQIVFAMESTAHYWLALFTRLRKDGYHVILLNPIQTSAMRDMFIRKIKTDAKDSFIIAELIRFGRYAESNVAQDRLLALKELCRNRFYLVDMAGDLKRKLIALIDRVFPEYEAQFDTIFCKSSVALLKKYPTPQKLSNAHLDKLTELLWNSSNGHFGEWKARELRELARNSFGVEDCDGAYSTLILLMLDQIQSLSGKADALEKEISRLFQSFDTTVTTIPGVGPIIGAVILSEVGDISRFSSADKLAAYTNRTFHHKLVQAGMTQSMSCVAHCIDNGPMEGFWGILKRERYYGRRFTSKHELVQMIQQYIRYYNTRRVQRNLGVLTPMEKHALCLAA